MLLYNDVSANNTIMLSVNDDRAPYLESMADESITPGMLLKRTLPTGGTFTNVSLFGDGAGTTCQPIFAVEDTRVGGTIADDYEAGDRVLYRACRKGDVVLGWLAASSSAVTVSTFLCPSSTAGYLTNIADPATLAVHSVIGIALEVSVGAVAQRIKIQIV